MHIMLISDPINGLVGINGSWGVKEKGRADEQDCCPSARPLLDASTTSGYTRDDGGDIIPAAQGVGALDEMLHALLWLVLLNDAHHLVFGHL